MNKSKVVSLKGRDEPSTFPLSSLLAKIRMQWSGILDRVDKGSAPGTVEPQERKNLYPDDSVAQSHVPAQTLTYMRINTFLVQPLVFGLCHTQLKPHPKDADILETVLSPPY